MHMFQLKRTLLLYPFFASMLFADAAPSVRILLPERTRLLQGQLVDLVLEVRNAKIVNSLQVTAGSTDITSKFGSGVAADLDCGSPGFVFRANLASFDTPGAVKLAVTLSADGTTVTDSRDIEVRSFQMPADGSRRNVILLIGD